MKKRSNMIAIIFVMITMMLLLSRYFGGKYELNEKYGPFYGVDVIAYVGDGMYEMAHVNGTSFLESNYSGDIILYNTYEYMFEENILYYYCEYGYAIVYPDSNLCKVFTFPDKHFEKNEPTEEYPLNKLIIYLDSFEEYTEYEQKMLNRITEKYESRQRRKGNISSFFDSLKD